MKRILLTLLLGLLTASSLMADDIVVKINFCAGNVTTSNSGWNNFTNNSNVSGSAVALKDVDGKSTTMSISLAAAFNGTNTEGVQSTTTSLNMTSKESYSAFWSQASGSNAKTQSGFTLNGLDPDAEYDFVIFGSRKGQTDNRETQYVLTGSNTGTGLLNCSSNATNVTTVNGLKADSSGKITLMLSPGSNNNNSVKYFYINTMQITQRGGSQDDESAIRILAIGNSFSEDAVENNLYDLAREAGIKVIIGNAYRGGQGLQSHWEDVTNNTNTFEYRKVINGVRTNTTGQALSTIVTDEKWDYITFQQVSGESGLPSSLDPYLGYLISYVKGLCSNPDVKLGYHMTWAYAQNSTHSSFPNYNSDQMTMYKAILTTVQKALADHPELTFVIPSGTAVQNARTSFIGDNMNRDGYHLNLSIGRYTAACTWLEAVLGVNPVGMTFHPTTIDDITASVGQKAAHFAIASPYSVTDMTNEGYDGDNTVTPAEVKINFGDSQTSAAGWNNMTSSITLLGGLKDVNGDNTEIIVMLDDAFNGTNTSGASSTTTSLDMPSEVSKSCFWGYCQGNFENQTQQPTGGFTFSHLNKSLAYDFTFYASRSGSSDNRETAFTLTGQSSMTAYLDGANNSKNTVTITGIRPDSNGTITLTVAPGSNNTNTYKFYYINALGIKAYTPEHGTGIHSIPSADELDEQSATIYNLQGQRLSKTQPGVNIVNGRKVIVSLP